MSWRAGWIGVVLCFSLGCGGPPPPASFPEALGLEAFEETLAQARCEQARSCVAPELAAACDGASPDARVALVRAGRLTYDEHAAGACALALATSCPVASGAPDAAAHPCDAAFAPVAVAPIGGPCIDSMECGEAAHCAEVAECGAGGVCVSRGRNGDPCTHDRGCEPEHDGAPQRCILGQCAHLYDGVAAAGEACGPLGAGTGDLVTSSVTPRCMEPEVCHRPTDALGSCVPVVEAGDACGPGIGACDGGTCTAGRCGPLRAQALGEPCRTGAEGCGPGLRCEAGTCAAWAGRLGEGCDAGWPCGADLTCDGGVCLRPGPRLGEACTDTCGEGICTGGVCRRDDGCVVPLPPDVSCAAGWPEMPSVLAYAECGASGPELRFVVTPEPRRCGETPAGAYYELLGPGALPLDGGDPSALIWYDEAMNRSGEARFCLSPDACSELVATRWNVDGLGTGAYVLSLAAACNDLRGVLVSLRRTMPITVCTPDPPTCP